MVAFSDGNLPEVTVGEFIEACNRTLSWAKWFSADINKTVLETLSNSVSEWVVVDLRCFTYDITKFDFGSGITGYTTGEHKEKFEVFKRKGLNFDSKKIDIRDVDLKKYVNEFAIFLKKKYGEKIILIDMREAFDMIGEDGSFLFNNPDLDAVFLEESTGLDFIKLTDCYYIKTPFNIIADCHHIWGGTPAHYISEYYDYAYNAILEIVQNHGKKSRSDIQLKLDMMFMETVETFSNIRRRKRLSVNNALKRAETQLFSGEVSEAMGTIGSLVEEGVPEAYGYFARMYRDGHGVDADLVKAAEWMRKAVDGNVWWAVTELLDILRKIGTQDALDEMLAVARTYSKKGNSNAMLRLGWAYRDGKGVEQDLDKAAEWMRQSASCGLGRAKNDLFDLLWRIDTPESRKEMVSIAKNHASNGDGSAMLRLGWAYRDGKGVEQDLDKAAEWMRKASEKIPHAKEELERLSIQ